MTRGRLRLGVLLGVLLLAPAGSGPALAQPAAPPPAATPGGPAAPSRAPAPEAAPALQVTLDGRTLSGREGDAVRWSRAFPPSRGPLGGPVLVGDLTWLAVGPQLYAFAADGSVARRLDLPADAAALDPSSGELRVTVAYGAVTETFTVEDDGLRERAVFPPLESTTGSLERAAREDLPFDPLRPGGGGDDRALLAERVRSDPTNPFSHAFLAIAERRAGRPAEAAAAVEAALAVPAPFFVSVRLARFFDAAGLAAAADRALGSARLSYAALGYDPALPVSRSALRAYGDPLGYTRELFAQNKTRRAEAWLAYLRDTSPRFEGYRGVYGDYVRLLEAQDRGGEAYGWRAFSRELDRGSLYDLGPDALLAVRDVARLAALALLVALAGAALALSARAWPQQTRDLAPLGGRWRAWARHPLSRVRRLLIAYWGFGEKLVVVGLLVGLLVALSAWTWSARTHAREGAEVLNFGTLGGAWFYDGLETLGLELGSPDARLLRGLAAQLDGDVRAAREQYGDADRDPCATNNLGVLLSEGGDPVGARAQYRLALTLDPTLPAPAYNLGLDVGSFETSFQRQFRSGPRLCYPSLRRIDGAVDGLLGGDLAEAARDPWTALTRFPSGLPRPVQWLWAGALLFATGLSVLWLFVPRVREARAARTPWRFRALSALLPGVAFLDVAWGLVLLLSWSVGIVGVLGAAGVLRFPFLVDLRAPGISAIPVALLIGCYAVNTLLLVLAALTRPRRRGPGREGKAA